MAPARKARNVKQDLRKLADVVQREVDAGADTVEEIHRSIARMPLDVFAKLDIFEKATKDVRKLQDTSIGAIYDLIRKVNHEVAKLAKELLDGRNAASKPVKRAAARRPVARKRAAAAGTNAVPTHPAG